MTVIGTMAPEKFMFERSFDTDQPVVAKVEIEEVIEEEEPEIELPSFSEEELEQAKSEAFEQGKTEALKESATAIENQLAETTKSIGEKLDSLIVGQLIANKDIFADAIQVSHAVTKKLLPSIATERSLPEIENIIRQVLVQVLEEPRVVIHINPSIEDLLNERIAKISSETHFEGRLHVMASDSIAEGDCKIEWSNGGADRNLEELMSSANAIIEASLETLEGGYVPSPDAHNLDELDQSTSPTTGSGESNDTTDPATNPPEAESTADPSDIKVSPDPGSTPPSPQTAPLENDGDSVPATGPTPEEAQNSAANEAPISAEAAAQPPDQIESPETLESSTENNSETNPSEGV